MIASTAAGDKPFSDRAAFTALCMVERSKAAHSHSDPSGPSTKLGRWSRCCYAAVSAERMLSVDALRLLMVVLLTAR